MIALSGQDSPSGDPGGFLVPVSWVKSMRLLRHKWSNRYISHVLAIVTVAVLVVLIAASIARSTTTGPRASAASDSYSFQFTPSVFGRTTMSTAGLSLRVRSHLYGLRANGKSAAITTIIEYQDGILWRQKFKRRSSWNLAAHPHYKVSSGTLHAVTMTAGTLWRWRVHVSYCPKDDGCYQPIDQTQSIKA
jgi:hypothetical protein